MSKKVIIVVTNVDTIAKNGKKTGWYLPEVAHPYHEFTKGGYEVTFVSSKGCKAPNYFVPIKHKNGFPLVKGATLKSFTNKEEEVSKFTDVIPLFLETKLRELEARFVGVENWKPNVQVCGRLVTGQNPDSASPMALETAKLLNKC